MGGRVEFLFQRGPIWQPGRVLKSNKDGTYVVRCELYDQDSIVRILDDPVAPSCPAARNNQEDEEPCQDYYDEGEVLEDFYATLKEEEKHTGMCTL